MQSSFYTRFYSQLLHRCFCTDVFAHRSIFHSEAAVTRRNLDREKPLHTQQHLRTRTQSFHTHRFYTEKPLHRAACTQSFYTENFLPQRGFGSETLLRTEVFPLICCHTEKLLQRKTVAQSHRAAFTHRTCYTQKFLHTQRRLYVQMFLQKGTFAQFFFEREAVTQSTFYTQKILLQRSLCTQ